MSGHADWCYRTCQCGMSADADELEIMRKMASELADKLGIALARIDELESVCQEAAYHLYSRQDMERVRDLACLAMDRK